jgi:hypothetical protein
MSDARLTLELSRRLRAICALHGVSMADVRGARRACLQYRFVMADLYAELRAASWPPCAIAAYLNTYEGDLRRLASPDRGRHG